MGKLIDRVIDRIIGHEPHRPDLYVPPEPIPVDYKFTEKDKEVLAKARADMQADKDRYNANMSSMQYACSTATLNWTRSVRLPNGKYVMLVDY